MKTSAWLWIIAVLFTLVSAGWQRRTGPTYPLSGRAAIGGTIVHYTLERSHKGLGDQRVAVGRLPLDITGGLEWKRYRSGDPWTVVVMRREGASLVAELPHQPPGGKLWYRVRLLRGPETILLPPARPAATRFMGSVPARFLVPHILCMFLAMLFSTRAGLEGFRRTPRLGALTAWTLAFMVAGGLALGPFVVHYAFGPWWSGLPVGTDITDSKTLVAVIVWIVAAIAVARARVARAWVLLAALVTLAIFAIPHSWTTTEPEYARIDAAAAAR
ncbi:MAG TPA: hypothetical protein VMS88_02135 [Terriglobales bacterium]|nr:hypothetical protein [Terriglobales bacterium]